MRSLIYSSVLATALTFAWFLHIVGNQFNNHLEIRVPPSTYGPPQVYIRSGSDIGLIRPFKETYSPEPSPSFLEEFKIPRRPLDEVRVISNLPPDSLHEISARLSDSDHNLLAQWASASFQPTSLDIAKTTQRFGTTPREAFPYATTLDCAAWHTSKPINKSGGLLLVSQVGLSVFFYVLFRFLPLWRTLFNWISRALNQPPACAKDIRPLPLSLACLFSTILVSLTVWTTLGTYFGTVDDPYMIQVAKGYLMKNPDGHLFFIHPVIGYTLVHLYAMIPNVPWYVLFMASVNVLSFSVILYVILRRSITWFRIIFWALLILLAGIYLIACIQFTMVSAIACSAAVMLLLGAANHASISKIRVATIVSLFLLGAAVRIHPALLVMALLGPSAAYLWSKGSLPGAKRVLLALLLGLALLAFTETSAYRTSPEWREAKLYDSARGMLTGTEIMKNYDDNAAVFQAVGWSKNDLFMFNECLNQDAAVFSRDKLDYLVAHLKQPPFKLKGSFTTLIHALSRDYPPVVFYLTSLILVLAWKLMPRLHLFMLAVPCAAALGYLAIFVRLPHRVLCPTIFIELSLLLLFANFENSKLKKRTLLFGTIIVTLIAGFLVFGSISGLNEYRQYTNQQKRSTFEALTYLSKTDSPIILNTVTGISSDETYLWQDFPELKNINILQLAWFESPIYNQRMERFGLSDTFTDLMHRPDLVIATTRYDLPQIIAIETFLREHKRIQAQFEPADIPGKPKGATFPFFSLFKAKQD